MFDSHSRTTVVFLSLIALFLYFQLFRFPFTPILFEGDHAVHLSNAWRMFQGEVAFRDFFLFTFPGTEIFYLSFFKLFGVKIWMLNITILFLILCLSAVGLYFSRTLLKGLAVYLPVTFFVVFEIRTLGIDGSHRFFSVLFVFLAIAVLLTQRTPMRLFSAGLLCGVASCFTQPRGLLGIAAIILFLFVEKLYKRQNLLSLIKSVLWVFSPFALVVGFTSLYFIISAGFETYYFSTFVFPVKHYPADVWNNPKAYLKDIPNIGTLSLSFYLRQTTPMLFNYFLIPLIYIVFFVVLWFRGQTISTEKKLQLILINLAGLLLAIGVFSAPNSIRFYQVSLPGLISLIWIFQHFFEFPKITFSLLLVLGLLGFAYTFQRATVPIHCLETPSGTIASLSSETLARYQWVAEHTRPGDYLYEPHHPSLYMMFHLRNPTPLPLIRPNNYTTPEQVKAIIEGLERNPPRYIIWDGFWDTFDSNESPDFHLEPLVVYVHNNYHLVKKLDYDSDSKSKVVEYRIEIWEKR